MERLSLVVVLVFVVCSKALVIEENVNSDRWKRNTAIINPNRQNSINSNSKTTPVDPYSQDNGIDHDFYTLITQYGLSQKDRQTKAQQYDQQRPVTSSLLQNFPRSSISTKNNFDQTRLKRRRNDPKFKSQQVFGSRSWLPVPMPDSVPYTGAILANHHYQGLLHTFLRHWDDWREFIANVDNGMGNLAGVQTHLDTIRDATNNQDSRTALNAFDQAFRRLSATAYNQLQDNLHDIQMEIYNFLLQNINDRTYLGRTINNGGQLQEFFRVTDRFGQQRVMVICVSDQLYPADPALGSDNVRTITTIFFMDNNTATSRLIT